MKTIVTLYRRDKLKRIQEWSIEVERTSFRTTEGLIDGVKSTSQWTECFGKNLGRANETSPGEQAHKEANSRIRMKLEEGWTDKLDEIDIVIKKVSPMLAENWQDYKSKILDSNTTFALQPKLDGIRCLATKHGLFTRNGKPITAVPHIEQQCMEILEGLPDDYILDGELYNHNLKEDFNKISSVVRKLRPTEEQKQESEKLIQYHIYDIDGTGRSFAERTMALRELLLQNRVERERKNYLFFVDSLFIRGDIDLELKVEMMDEHYKRLLEDGYEGQMVRVATSIYENYRSKNLLKRKEFITEEFTIVGIEEGLGNRSGMMGRIKFEGFDANARGNFDFFKELLENKEEYIGKKATVRYQNLTPDGKPRFPVVITIRDYE